MTENLITLSVEDGVAVLTVNRPDKMNALNSSVFDEFNRLLDQLESADSVRALLITGAGEKAFVAGADISELAEMNAISGKATSEKGQRVFDRIENFSRPVVAAVNGFALGGGCELALAAHIRLCSDKAVFGFPEVGLAIIPGYAGTQRLPRLIGKGRAMELILTGSFVKAEEAHSIGLANKVFPAETFMQDVDTYIRKNLLTKGPLAQKLVIEVINSSTDVSLKDGQALEANAFGLLSATADMHEGMSAFMEKRKPEFNNN